MTKETDTVAEPIENPIAEEAVTSAVKEKKKKEKDHWELHDYMWLAAIVLGIISILFVLLAKNAVNEKTNVVTFTFNFPWMSKAANLKIPFLNAQICGIIGGIFGLLSTAAGIFRNILKKQNSMFSYLLGVAATVLSVVAFLAGYYKG